MSLVPGIVLNYPFEPSRGVVRKRHPAYDMPFCAALCAACQNGLGDLIRRSATPRVLAEARRRVAVAQEDVCWHYLGHVDHELTTATAVHLAVDIVNVTLPDQYVRSLCLAADGDCIREIATGLQREHPSKQWIELHHWARQLLLTQRNHNSHAWDHG